MVVRQVRRRKQGGKSRKKEIAVLAQQPFTRSNNLRHLEHPKSLDSKGYLHSSFRSTLWPHFCERPEIANHTHPVPCAFLPNRPETWPQRIPPQEHRRGKEKHTLRATQRRLDRRDSPLAFMLFRVWGDGTDRHPERATETTRPDPQAAPDAPPHSRGIGLGS